VAENAELSRASSLSTEREAVWVGKAVVAAVILTAFLMALQPVRSADVWHHVKSGWLVRQNHGPAHTDVFSCTAEGKRWIQYEWLAQLLIHLAHEGGGVAGLLMFRTVGVAAAAGLLLLACRGRRAGWPASGAAVAFALCAASGRFYSRPEIFTLVVLAGLMASFERLRQGQGRFLSVPAVLMIPWVNMHGAWVAGLAYMGLMCAGDTLSLMLKVDTAKPKRTITLLWLALALATAATLVNPYGVHIWEVPFKLSRTPVVRQVINEWKIPDRTHWLSARHMAAYLPFLMVLLASVRYLTPGDGLNVLFFGVLALAARRHLALAMLVTAPVFARHLTILWERGRHWAFVRKRLAQPSMRAALVILLCVVLLVTALGGLALPRAGVGLARNKYPFGAGRFLEANQLDGNLFNSYAFGNYLLFARYPRNHVFIDGRVDMYGAEVVDLYRRVGSAKSDWREILQRYSIEICVLESSRRPDAPLLNALHQAPDWALVYWDDLSAIYVQETPAQADFLRQAYIYAVPPDSPNPPMIRTPAGLARAERDYEKKLEEDPDCVPALWGKGECLRRRGALAEAIATFGKAVGLAPRVAMLNFNLGACLLETGRSDEAEHYLKRALRLARPADEETPRLRQVALWNLSLLYERRGERERAIEMLDELLEIAPNHTAAVEQLRVLRQKSAETGRGI